MPQGIIWRLVKEFSSFDTSPAVPLLRLTCKVIQQTLYKETALRFVSFLLTLALMRSGGLGWVLTCFPGDVDQYRMKHLTNILRLTPLV